MKSTKNIGIIIISFLFITCVKDPILDPGNTGPNGLSVECANSNNPILNSSSIEGYLDQISYKPGETINMMIHSVSEEYSLSIIKYGEHEDLLYESEVLSPNPQNYFCYSYSLGCDWNRTHHFEIPIDYKSGLHAVKLQTTNGNSFYIPFVMKPYYKKPSTKIAVLASTNTWQAYNKWGGGSFYNLNHRDDIDYAQKISTERPNSIITPYGDYGHLVNGELHILRWLEKQYYHFDLFADIDFHTNYSLFENYDVILISTHSEYWSLEMMNNLERFLASGKNVMYLSGNGLYWKTVVAYDRLEVRKDYTNHTYDEGAGGRWRDVELPEAALIGLEYTSAGFGTWAPFEVLNESHWIFKNTNLKNGDLFGEDGINGGGASGWETDKINPNLSPSNLDHIAKGTNPGDGGADMIYFETQNGGKVFSAGSISYGGSLIIDPIVSQITKNVVDSFISN
ncbi:MAG: hypothetical protein HRT72_03455 [Flavobacteriales bacterium]|nr:hypothetical protein [Flavobacteriales bacterium]